MNKLSDPGSDDRLMALEERWRSDRSPLVFLQFADELRRSGQTRRAIEVLREGLEWHPESISGWVVLGRTLLEEGDPKSALQALDKALERDPAQLVATKLSADAWIALRDPQRASEALGRYRLLSAPGAELERLESEIEALRSGGGGSSALAEFSSADATSASWSSTADGDQRPFEVPQPSAWPALDGGRASLGGPTWTRAEVDREPFRELLATPSYAASRRLARLAAEGPFGVALEDRRTAGEAETAVAILEPPTSAAAEELTPPELDLAPPSVATGTEEATEADAVGPIEVSTALEPEAPAAEAVAELGVESSTAVGVGPPAEPIFEPMSIGEEVERETASAAEAAPGRRARISGSTTLAALYLAQGHLEEAAAEYRSVLELRPGDESALAALAKIEASWSGVSAPSPVRETRPVDAARPLGLTARKLLRLRALYDRLRGERLARSHHVP